MNHALLKEIVTHVMAHFGVVPSNFVNHKKTGSLMAPAYLLPDRIIFEVDGEQHKGKVWGCQIKIGPQEVKVLLGDCTVNQELPEFAMIINPGDNIFYGLFLCHNELFKHPMDSEPDLCVSLDNKTWMECTTYLQGTFLAATEQLREVGFGWTKLIDYKNVHEALLSFMNFHDARFGD